MRNETKINRIFKAINIGLAVSFLTAAVYIINNSVEFITCIGYSN
jgi:hypothetical protein